MVKLYKCPPLFDCFPTRRADVRDGDKRGGGELETKEVSGPWNKGIAMGL